MYNLVSPSAQGETTKCFYCLIRKNSDAKIAFEI